jgi:hypothetical protein
MKTVIIIILVIVVGLAITGGGMGSFFSNVGKGVEKVGESGVAKSVIDKGKSLISTIFETKSATIENLPENVTKDQMQMALRIKELTDKGKDITYDEYKELGGLVATYEKNWG